MNDQSVESDVPLTAKEREYVRERLHSEAMKCRQCELVTRLLDACVPSPDHPYPSQWGREDGLD